MYLVYRTILRYVTRVNLRLRNTQGDMTNSVPVQGAAADEYNERKIENGDRGVNMRLGFANR